MGTAAGMIEQARLLLGLGEEPPGSNHNRVTKWYGIDAPWCNMAISFEAGHSANLDAIGGKFAWTVAHAWSPEHGQLRWSQEDLDAIAGRFGLSRENIRQVRARLIRKLRAKLEPLLNARPADR